MTYAQAVQILDKVREGQPYPEATINRCLQLTGDLELHEGLRSAGVDSEIPAEGWRERLRQRQIMVGRSKE